MTGWHGTRLSGLRPGESVVVYGGGPVGLMAAYSAQLQGASHVMLVDRQADRLKLAESIGVTTIDDSKIDSVEQVLELTGGEGADRGVEAVGYQAHDHEGNEDLSITLNALVGAVKATGGIGVVGVWIPADPGAESELAQDGKVVFDYGDFWFKGQSMATGQCNVKAYNRELGNLIHQGKANASFIISHELALDRAPDAYSSFDKRDEGWTKVVLKPQMAA